MQLTDPSMAAKVERRVGMKSVQRRGTIMNDVFNFDVSDEALENAGGMSAAAQAGSSLYSSYDASGCTCVD
jgi:hypothetical protein